MASRTKQNTSNVSDASSSASFRTQSPIGQSRIHEKLELQGLNDRLAGYIDRVRFLETENNRLTLEVKTVHETVSRETVNIKKVCILWQRYLRHFLCIAVHSVEFLILYPQYFRHCIIDV